MLKSSNRKFPPYLDLKVSLVEYNINYNKHLTFYRKK